MGGEPMRIKGRIIEVGSDGHHPVVTLHVENIDHVRSLAGQLYEHVDIVKPWDVPDDMIGGSHVCETCAAHCVVIEDLRARIAELEPTSFCPGPHCKKPNCTCMCHE